MAESSSNVDIKEGEEISGSGANDPSRNEQPTTSAEDSQSVEQDQTSAIEKETSAEQPHDTSTVPEGSESQEGHEDGQSATKEEEGGIQEEESGTVSKPSDIGEQTSSDINIAEDKQVLDQTTEVVSNEEKVANEDGPAGNGEERESDGQKQSESTSDEQQKQQDQIEKEADTLKSDEQATVVEGEPTAVVGVQDTEKPESGDQHVEDKESAKVEEESVEGHAPTGEESGVIGVSVLNEPLADIVEEDEEQEPIKREELLAETKEVLLEQERLKSVSAQLQHKIAEYLAKKKTEERPDPGRNVTDQEKRYNQCMAALEMLEMDLNTMQQRSELQDAHLLILREQKLAEVTKEAGEFAGYKKDIATTAVHSRTGRRLQAQEVEQFQAAEDKKESELILVRLENIKLQNKISKLEAQIKEKEQLAEGLHMIDFEQLKINNVDLNEKIEERNEDILKLRKKVTSTVQVLTHVKEKLQFLQAENGEKRAALRNIDEIVAKKRDHLTRTKQARDALRMDNLRLKQKGGLVSHPALLGDFEERKDQNDELRVVLEKLQQRHSELTVTCDGLRKKVEQARTIHP